MRNKNSAILFYCQHSLGMGHLVRSLALAERLAKEFRVILLSGGRFPKKIRIPENIEIINLPPLGFNDNFKLISCDKRRTVERAKYLRKEIILETFHQLKPEIVLIELFPFGRKKFAQELLPLLEIAKGKAKIICSLRDILVGNRDDQKQFETQAIKTANQFFDAVLVHSDQNFAKFEDSLKTKEFLQIPTFYTGFVVPKAKPQTFEKRQKNIKKIIVSAGGGIVGERLLRTAIEAHKLLSKRENIETKIITGLFLPKKIFQKLEEETKEIKGLKISRFVRNLRGEMANSDVSISQCGYNTAFDILLSGVSAIVVPYSENGEDEQNTRAKKLEKMKALKVLDSVNLNAERLASEIKKSFTFQAAKLSLDIQGGKNSAEILQYVLPSCYQAKINRRKFWLQSVREILEEQGEQVRIFFRNDDAGIADKRLFSLLDIFEKHSMPIDLATIPKEITKDFADKLKKRIHESNGLVSIHQHGFSHTNHETEGRKYEFGISRSSAKQFNDISEGKKILQQFFGKLVQPIFTPPWNRCTDATAKVLSELEFRVLSRESKAKPLEIKDLMEIPVSVDWFAKRKGIYLEKEEVAAMIAEKIAAGKHFGIMLHHAEMNEKERNFFEQLCRVFAEFPQIKFVPMWDVFLRSQESFFGAKGLIYRADTTQ